MNKLLVFFLIQTSLSFGATAPPFRGTDFEGESISLQSTLKPNRVLFLAFWATWCVPCLEELKALKTGLENDKDLPLDILTVNVDTGDSSGSLRSHFKVNGLHFPVLLDPKHEIFEKYVAQKSLPASFLIGPDGTILESYSGYHEGMFTALKQKVLSTLESKNAKS